MFVKTRISLGTQDKEGWLTAAINFQHMHTCRPVSEVQIESFAGSIASYLTEILQENKNVHFAMETNGIFVPMFPVRKHFSISWFTRGKFIRILKGIGETGKAV